MTRDRAAIVMLLALTLGACVADKPDGERPGRAGAQAGYTVRGGDTLSAIATRLGIDMRVLARINGLSPPFIIRIGQRLTIPVAERSTRNRSPERRAPQPPPREALAARMPAPPRPARPAPLRPGVPFKLVWPADGLASPWAGESDGALLIAAHRGTAVRSASAGTVVFAGPDARDGQVVRVDHGGGWLTAYGQLGQVVVRPGEKVAGGARLGFIGVPRAGSDPGLRFELRRDGAPVDPLPWLPPRF